MAYNEKPGTFRANFILQIQFFACLNICMFLGVKQAIFCSYCKLINTALIVDKCQMQAFNSLYSQFISRAIGWCVHSFNALHLNGFCKRSFSLEHISFYPLIIRDDHCLLFVDRWHETAYLWLFYCISKVYIFCKAIKISSVKVATV